MMEELKERLSIHQMRVSIFMVFTLKDLAGTDQRRDLRTPTLRSFTINSQFSMSPPFPLLFQLVVLQELAKLLLHSLRDPRAEFVNVTAVDVSRDLRYAKVFFTKIGLEDAKSAQEVTAVLDKAAGYLRSEIARDSSLRTVPKLSFKFDESVGRGRHMEALLGQALASDEKHEDAPESEED